MEQYYQEARLFCKWAEELDSITEENACEIVLKLMKLYALSACLPDIETDEAYEGEAVQHQLSFAVPSFDAYWEIYNPYVCDEPVCGSLYDDICSVYSDLRSGVLLYERGCISEAAWEWKQNFEQHWRFHAVDAIRALNGMQRRK